MKVMAGFLEKITDLEILVKDTLEDSAYPGGTIECIENRIDNLINMNAKLVTLLVEKGLVTDIKELIGCLYDVEVPLEQGDKQS